MTFRCKKCGQDFPSVPERHFSDGKACDGTFEVGEWMFVWKKRNGEHQE